VQKAPSMDDRLWKSGCNKRRRDYVI
jgi:hypothetical protein